MGAEGDVSRILHHVGAFFLGMLIGSERQYRQRTAGLRTNVLASIRAAAFVDLGMRLSGNRVCTRQTQRDCLVRTFVELGVRARRIPKFPVEGLAVFDTAAQELWPVRHGKVPGDWLWQQTPKLRMMPAQIVTTAVTVSANARAQPHHLSN